jgi:ribosomal protein S18 acetylase RimI-like enzyme
MRRTSAASIVRPARSDDIRVLGDLLVQLYAAELPGALIGSIEGQRSVLRFTLEAQPALALRHRYVLCNAADQVLATGMIQFPTEPAFERAPAGTVRTAMRLLGYRATARLLLTVARSLIGVYSQRSPDTVLLHSVVVDAQHRRQGLGHSMMDTLERIAAEQGYQWAVLQVLADNHGARHLYLERGYQDIGRTPRWVDWLSWPSFIMRKGLDRI